MKTKAKELREQAAAKFKEAKDYLDGIGKDDWEELGDDQKGQFNVIMKEAKDLDEAYAKAAAADGDVEHLTDRMSFYHEKATGRRIGFQPVEGYESPKSIGQLFVDSDEYKDLMKSGVLNNGSSKFNNDIVVAKQFTHEEKAANDLISTFPGNGSGAESLTWPARGPWPLPLPARPMMVRDLFASGTINTDLLIYAQQIGRDSGVAAYSQATAVDGTGLTGGVKPQSSISFEEASAPVKNIATWMAATRQSLQDASVLRSLIDSQGRLMLDLYVDDQLMNGDGNGPNLSGIRDQTIQTLDLTGEDNLDGIRTARRLVHTGYARVPADSIVVNPIDSEYIDLLKDGQGLYRGGNPIGNFTMDQSIWKLRRVESEAIPAGIALAGAFSYGATVLARTPMQVYTTDSHADFFIRNLIVILFEERLAFPVWWPDAFVEITLDAWAAAS